MKKCKNCNNPIGKKEKFCPHCNTKVKKSRIGLIILLLFCFGLGVGVKEMISNPEKYNASPVGVAVDSNSFAIESVLAECGITQIKSMKHDELLDNAHFDGEKGYRVADNHADNIIVYLDSNNEVYTVKYSDYILYADNEVKGNIEDYIH